MAARTSQRAVPTSAVSAGTSIPWGKLVAGLAIAYGAWAGWHKVGGADGISRASHFGSTPSVEQLGQLAASRQSSDVLMYSAAWCPNCTAAKGWMGQYGFKYQECDIDKDSACMAQLKALDPQGGVPYLIVRGQHIKDGFDSEQFLVALAKSGRTCEHEISIYLHLQQLAQTARAWRVGVGNRPVDSDEFLKHLHT